MRHSFSVVLKLRRYNQVVLFRVILLDKSWYYVEYDQVQVKFIHGLMAWPTMVVCYICQSVFTLLWLFGRLCSARIRQTHQMPIIPQYLSFNHKVILFVLWTHADIMRFLMHNTTMPDMWRSHRLIWQPHMFQHPFHRVLDTDMKI